MLAAGRQVGGARREIEQRQPPVGAGDREGAVGIDDVALRRFEQLGGDALALLDQDVDARAPGRRRPSWSSATPSRRRRRRRRARCRPGARARARAQCRAVRRRGGDRPWRGPGRSTARRAPPSACRRRETAAPRSRSARRRHVRESRRCRCRAAGRASPPRACAWRSRHSRRPPAPCRTRRESRRSRRWCRPRSCRGWRSGGIEIRAADLVGGDAGDARGLVDQPFEEIVRLRPAGAAIGRRRHRVGEDAGDADVDLRDAIHGRESSGRNCWWRYGRRPSPHRRRD